jgi:hypothetical protein
MISNHRAELPVCCYPTALNKPLGGETGDVSWFFGETKSMAHTWRQVKNTEQFNKGRAALRGDYLKGTYDKCALADVGPHYKHCAAIYEKAQARANRPLSQRGYATLARVIKKMDKGNHHFVTGVKPTRKEKRMAKYVTQEA